MFGFILMFYEPSYASVQQWEQVVFDSGSFHTFDKSQDLFRDGSVRLLPTPGHTPGHTSALADMSGYQLLVTGDCLYTSRHLAYKQFQQIRFNKKSGAEHVASMEKIVDLKKVLPGLHLVTGHDHTDYQWKHLVPYLSKGSLTAAERQELLKYESSLFDGNWALLPEDLPQFLPDSNGGRAGTVREPVGRNS